MFTGRFRSHWWRLHPIFFGRRQPGSTFNKIHSEEHFQKITVSQGGTAQVSVQFQWNVSYEGAGFEPPTQRLSDNSLPLLSHSLRGENESSRENESILTMRGKDRDKKETVEEMFRFFKDEDLTVHHPAPETPPRLCDPPLHPLYPSKEKRDDPQQRKRTGSRRR